MRAIVKPWDEIRYFERVHNRIKEHCGNILDVQKADLEHSPDNWFYLSESGWGISGQHLIFINEDEWDAEIYALLLIESGVIYER